MKTRGFEIVRDDCRKHSGEIILPQRATTGSMAYDFFAPDDYEVYINHIVKIWTDVKAYMQPGEGLMINIRSSMGGRFQLSNGIGYIDCDYYSNIDNDGNIGIFLRNVSDEIQYIKKGQKIAQGVFVPVLFADNDDVITERIGGFGSTGL